MGSVIIILVCFTCLASADVGYFINLNCPVWEASKASNRSKIDYDRMGSSNVLNAITNWQKSKLYDASNTDILYQEKTDQQGVASKDPPFTSPRPPPEVREIQVLVVMDTGKKWQQVPKNGNDLQKFTDETIIRAVSFWYGMHQRLKTFNTIRYKIHIAGIVIGRHPEAMPYLRDNEDKRGRLNPYDAAVATNTHWKQVALDNNDFPLDSYQVIAVMTESPVCPECRLWNGASKWSQNSFVYAGKYGRGFYDFTEDSMGQFLHDWSQSRYTFYGPIAHGQKMEGPLPLPGQIISLNKQCEAWGWLKNNDVCFSNHKNSPCGYFTCKNNHMYSVCEHAPEQRTKRALDGSYCGDGLMCLNGKCVKNEVLPY